jgi:hypothetical protein
VNPSTYPVAVRARFDHPSRWLWLVKWLLLIPHYIVLAFLWLAFVIVTVIAFFAILFTRTYPRGLFDFNRGVLRWSWRVSYYGYSALATDRYPPFTLADVPEYPARLEVEYPGELNRWLPLVKWLLAFPHYLILSGLAGAGSTYIATSRYEEESARVSGPGLLLACVLISAVALLFVARYPTGLYDLVVGINRWSYRVVGYLALMTDRYPPFRLDQGGEDPAAGPGEGPDAGPSMASAGSATPT